MKLVNFLKGFAWWIVLAAVLAFSFCYVLPSLRRVEEEISEKAVVSVWNVDTFEGGKGSRTSFLNKVAKEIEESGEVVFIVSAKTAEGVKEAFSVGEMPDIISYGVGVELPKRASAECWCMGKYALFRRQGVSVSATAENTVLSVGGENLPMVAAAMAGFSGGLKTEKSLQAYMRFLNGNFTYLLGTQRDAQRLIARGLDVQVLPLNGYTDLRQYVAVLSKDNAEVCNLFVKHLLSEDVQRNLTTIGMFSERYEIYSSDLPLCADLERGKVEYFLPENTSIEERERLDRQAEEILLGKSDLKILKKFLKQT